MDARLTVLDFGHEIDRLVEGFTGREWVFQAIDDWLRDRDERFLLLTGEPGIGKSALAARLTQVRDDVVAFNFCTAGRSASSNPSAVIRSLAAQLGAHLPGYGIALANTVAPTHLTIEVNIDVESMSGGQVTGVIINHLHASSLRDEVEILLRAPLTALAAPPAPAMIVIDSLDEAAAYSRHDEGTGLVALLSALDDMPEWMRFLCTSRPDRRVLRHFASAHSLVLEPGSPDNARDIRGYIGQRVQQPSVQQRLTDEVTEGALAERLAELASGNFLYIAVLISDIAQGLQQLTSIDALPRSLDEIYHRFLLRLEGAWEDRYQPVLEILAVAQEPLPEAQLAAFTGISRGKVRQALGVARQFLDSTVDAQGNEAYTLFHQSLRDYLLDDQRNQDFWCEAESGHLAITRHYLSIRAGEWEQCDGYGLRHLPSHLRSAGQLEHLARLVTDPGFLAAVEPRSLLSLPTLMTDAAARVALGVYRQVARAMLLAESSERASYLEMGAHARGHVRFARDIAAVHADRPWASRWARSRRLADHMVVGHQDSGVAAIAVGAVGDEAVIASGSFSEVCIWNCDGAGAIGDTRHLENMVTALAFATIDDELVLCCGDHRGELHIWPQGRGRPRRTPLGHSNAVRALATATLIDGRPVLVSGDDDGVVRVWDFSSEQPLGGPRQHSHAVSAVATGSSRERDVVVAAGHDGTICTCDPADEESPLRPLLRCDYPAMGLAIEVMDGSQAIVVAVNDATVRFLDLERGSAVRSPLTPHDQPSAPAIATGRLGEHSVILTGGRDDKALRLWDLKSQSLIRDWEGHPWWVGCVAAGAHRGRPLFVSAGDDGDVRVWDETAVPPDQDSGEALQAEVTSMGAGHAGTQPIVVTGDRHGDVAVWRHEDGAQVVRFERHEQSAVTSLAVGELAGDTVIVSGGLDGIRIWSPPGRFKPLHALPGRGSTASYQVGVQVAIGALGPTGRVAVACADGTIGVWDAPRALLEPFTDREVLVAEQMGENAFLRAPRAIGVGEADGEPVVVAANAIALRAWAADGALLWSVAGSEYAGPAGPDLRLLSSFAIGHAGGSAVVASLWYSHMLLFDLATGAQLHDHLELRHPRGDAIVAAVGDINRHPVVVTGAGDVLFVWNLIDQTPRTITVGRRICQLAIESDTILVATDATVLCLELCAGFIKPRSR